MKVKFFDKERIVELSAIEISNKFKRLKKIPVLLLLSGGSAIEMYNYIDPFVLYPSLTFAVLDERYSTDPQVNNFAQITKTKLFMEGQKNGVNSIDTRVNDLATQKQVTIKFEKDLRNWKEDNINGLVISIMGIGSDGHIAGIMPIPEDLEKFSNLFEKNNWVVGYDTENRIPFRYRVTTTLTFLKNEIDYSYVFISDVNKKDITKKALEKNKSLNEIPARVICQMKNVELLTCVKL